MNGQEIEQVPAAGARLGFIDPGEARVNVTYAGQNGDLPDPVSFDSTDEQVRALVTEAVRNGGVPGLAADGGADFHDFVIDRFAASEARAYNLLQVRPKTPFGSRVR